MAFKSIFDKSFKYRNSSATDVRQTFERIKREQRLQEQHARGADCDDRSAKVVATIGRSRPPAAVT